MQLVSFDIGAKHLSYCILDGDRNIILWDMENLINTDWQVPMCAGFKKRGKEPCTSKAKYMCTTSQEIFDPDCKAKKEHSITYFCKVHLPDISDDNPICTKCLKTNAKFIQDDQPYCGRHINKKEKYTSRPIVKHKIVKKKLVNDVSYQDLTVRVIECLERHRDAFLQCDYARLELQLHENARIKFISHIIFTWFVKESLMSGEGKLKEIRNVLAVSKFKCYTGPEIDTSHIKGDKPKRKYAAEQMTKWMLQNNKQAMEKLGSFESRGIKLDDLSDSFLQGLASLEKIK